MNGALNFILCPILKKICYFCENFKCIFPIYYQFHFNETFHANMKNTVFHNHAKFHLSSMGKNRDICIWNLHFSKQNSLRFMNMTPGSLLHYTDFNSLRFHGYIIILFKCKEKHGMECKY